MPIVGVRKVEDRLEVFESAHQTIWHCRDHECARPLEPRSIQVGSTGQNAGYALIENAFGPPCSDDPSRSDAK
jgi:hypothetical protein